VKRKKGKGDRGREEKVEGLELGERRVEGKGDGRERNICLVLD